MIPLWAYASGGALMIGLLGGWTVRDWKADADDLRAVNAGLEVRAKLERENGLQAGRLENFAAFNQAQAVSERNTIERIYRDVKVPGDCAVPADAWSVLETARQRANRAASGELGAALPSDKPSAGIEVGPGASGVGN